MCVSPFKIYRTHRVNPEQYAKYNKQTQNIPDVDNKEFNLPFGSETLSEEETLNFKT